MPTSLAGLLIFAALVVPGFTYLLTVERGLQPGRRVSVFRETAQVAVAGTVAWTATVTLLAIMTALVPQWDPPSIERLLREPRPYVEKNYEAVFTWGVGLLAFTSALSYMWAARECGVKLRNLSTKSRVGRLLGPPTGVSFESAWWHLLKDNLPDHYRRIHCRLTDGTEVEGWLHSFSHESEENADRDLALSGPLYIWEPDGTVRQEPGGLVIGARAILYLLVNYHATADVAPQLPDEA